MKAEIDKSISTLLAEQNHHNIQEIDSRMDGDKLIKTWEIGDNIYYETYTVEKVEVELP